MVPNIPSKEIQMKSNFRIMLAITILAMAALACQALSGGDDPLNEGPSSVASPQPSNTLPSNNDDPAPVPTEPDVPFDTGDIILSDDFSSDQWGTGTDADSGVEYVGNALNFVVFTDNYFVWSTPDDEVYSDIHMEVTVINNGTDSTTAFGFMCNKSTGNDFYYFAFTPAGQYAIAKAVEGETDVFLTNNDEWADSDLIPVNAGLYRVGADCGNGLLALYIDGQLIDMVSDLSYTSGRVAVFVWSGEEVGITTDMSFDDFEITELP
jgi:hypothetical protein